MGGDQLDLDSWRPPRFDGDDYVPERDDARLGPQLQRVWSLMRDGKWRTLSDIEKATGDPPASISAQLRHLRKPRFGGHQVDRQHVGNGLYWYRVVPSQNAVANPED